MRLFSLALLVALTVSLTISARPDDVGKLPKEPSICEPSISFTNPNAGGAITPTATIGGMYFYNGAGCPIFAVTVTDSKGNQWSFQASNPTVGTWSAEIAVPAGGGYEIEVEIVGTTATASVINITVADKCGG